VNTTDIFKLFARKRLTEAAVSKKLERARSLLGNGQLDVAMSMCEDLLKALPEHYESICLVGEIGARKGAAQEALGKFARAIQLQPDQPLAYYKRANVLKDCGRPGESLDDYGRAIVRNPSFAHALCNQGVVLQQLNRFQEALDSYGRAIELDPTDAFSFFNRGAVLRELNRPDEALASYEKAILLKPDFAECYCNLGLLQVNLECHQAALSSYDRCIEINPEFFAAHFNRGALLESQNKWDEALASYSRVIELKPDHADAYGNRGVVLTELRRTGAALADFEYAAQLRPDFAEAYLNRGNLLAQNWRYREAVESFDKAIAAKSDYADAFYSRADTLVQMLQFAAAIDSYDAVFRLDPNRRFLRGMRLYARMNLCDWTDFDIEIERVCDVMASPPFPLLALVDQPELHLKCAQSWVRQQCSISGSPDVILKREKRAKIRIGYFSGDFRIHPVSALMVGVIENHDRARFENIAFSYGPNVQDEMRQRMEKAFDRFLDVSGTSDKDVAKIARSFEIDIAVDLAGYTGNGRAKIFAWRPAPIQASYIGYLGATGAPYMDYLLADQTIIPAAERQFYSEKIIYLPSYQANDSKRRISDTIYTREQLGLPQDAFVFACFNSNYKITPTTFSVWMRILNRVLDSVLYLYASSQIAEDNLRLQAERCGIDPRRIVFGEKLAFEDYLARFRVMDLFLDTLPYNAGTTASDALWAGLPVITCAGRAFAGRMAASLLTAINLPELITETIVQYEDLAVKLAMSPNMMAKVRHKLARNRLTAPLFNTVRFTRNLEAAYLEAVQRYDAHMEPKDIYVADMAES
jgi:predicted O-linked N-acetylglucosamine transferase (SPINDLY family)